MWLAHVYLHCNTLLQHTTVTHYCNTLLQHITATLHCNILLQHTCDKVTSRVNWKGAISTRAPPLQYYCNTLLQHTSATHYCNILLQHATATHYWNTHLTRSRHKLIGKVQLAHVQLHCNTTATHQLQHTVATHDYNTLRQHFTATHYCNTHMTRSRCRLIGKVRLAHVQLHCGALAAAGKHLLQHAALLQHTAATPYCNMPRYCNTLLQHPTATCRATATHCCNNLLQYTTKIMTHTCVCTMTH